MEFGDAKEEIRERLDLVEIIGQYVRLRRSGSRFVGLCPFHQDSAPSFSVDPARGFWHCFGCGEGGDLFSFVMRQEGLTFPEALRLLAQRAGVRLESDPQADERRRRRELLERAHQIAREHFIRNLFEHPAAAPARNYLRRRGFNRWALDTFGIGYALEAWDDLLNTLAAQGINATIAEEAGLAKPGEHGGHYDTFRDRIIFPIGDVSGRTIAFGGRALDPDNPAKYLNSPETPLFRKRRALYALDVARQAISAQGRAIIVEGYTDVISLHQAGIGNVVAGLGTALTREQLDLVGRYADEVVLVYDADAAGARAALRNLEVFAGADVEVSLVVLPENLDPDEFVRSRGPEAFTELLSGRISPVEYELRMAFARHADSGAQGRAQAIQEAVDVLMKVEDWTARDEYLRRAVDFWAEGDAVLGESMQRAAKLEFGRRSRAGGRQRRGPEDSSYITRTLTSGPGGLLRAEAELLAQALDDEQLARRLADELEPEDLLDEADAAILRALQEHLRRSGNLDVRALVEGLPEEGGVRRRGVELTVAVVRRTERETEADFQVQAERTIRRLKARRKSGGELPLTAGSEAVLARLGTSVEDYRELKRQVEEGINSGEITPDDPRYVRFREITAALRARPGGAFFGEPSPSRHQRERQARNVQPQMPGEREAQARRASPRRGGAETALETPGGDVWAVDEGDPFAEPQ